MRKHDRKEVRRPLQGPGTLDDLCRRYHAYANGDNTFQRRARLLQALWREAKGYEIGLHRGQPLGSRLAMPFAEETLNNYLIDTIRRVVEGEVIGRDRNLGQLYAEPRIFDDLLSSQALCFNLFGEFDRNLSLASAVFADLTSKRVSEVTKLRWEYSPGRRNPLYTNDGTSSDLSAEFLAPSGRPGILSIETKYHESMNDKPSEHKPRYDELAEGMGIFRADRLDALRSNPLQQIWRDHLLVGSIALTRGLSDGLFAFVYPKDNFRCAEAIRLYLDCLTRKDTVFVWTLEDVVASIRRQNAGSLAALLHDRYLAFDKIESLSA